MKTLFLLLIPIILNAQTIYFTQDTLAYDNLFNNRQFPAYDSEGKLHITYTGQNGTDGATREIYYLKEQPNGSFEKSNLTNNTVDDNYSTLSIDQNDKIHVGLTGRDGSNLFQIKYINNISGSFTEPKWITSGGLNKATPYSKIGPDSVMHFVYFTYTEGADNAYYKKYDLRTSTLSSEIFLAAAEAGGDFEAALDADQQGKVHIVVKSGGLFGGPLKYFTDISGTLQEVQTGVVGNITTPRVKANNNGIHILYRLETGTRLHYINNSSGSFTTPLPVSGVGQRPAGYQNFSIDDAGNLYFIYQSSVAAAEKGFFLVFANNDTITPPMLIYDLTPEYVTRNSSMVITRGVGNFAVFYAPGAVRNSFVICDIFMKRGNIFDIIPVELESFTASAAGNNIELKWVTSSEKNNFGFDIERNSSGRYIHVAFISGKGTATEQNIYRFVDEALPAGRYSYRLIQIDYDGSRTIAGTAEVEITSVPEKYALFQNYPNPFNPETVIKYQIPENSYITLKIYDITGNEVAVLFEGEQLRGSYSVNWNAAGLPSGSYFYTLTTGNYKSTRKLMLIK
jgi:hypothetical protein